LPKKLAIEDIEEIEEVQEVSKEVSGDTTTYRIIQGFTYDGIKYNLGEPLPDLSIDKLNDLYAIGYLAKEDKGRISKVNKDKRLTDEELRMLSELPSNLLADRLSSFTNIHVDSLRKLQSIMSANTRRKWPVMLTNYINNRIKSLEVA